MLGTSLQLPNGLMVMPDTDVPQDHYICNGDNKVRVSEYDFKILWDNAQNNEELSKIIGKLKVESTILCFRSTQIRAYGGCLDIKRR